MGYGTTEKMGKGAKKKKDREQKRLGPPNPEGGLSEEEEKFTNIALYLATNLNFRIIQPEQMNNISERQTRNQRAD